MSDITLTASQKIAAEQILDWAAGFGGGTSQAISLAGPAGTGKTTLLRHIWLKLAEAGGVPITWTAMTGKAALRLCEVTGEDATTLHSALYEPPDRGSQRPNFSSVNEPPGGIVIIDEASMVTEKICGDLDAWLDAGTRILFVGDDYQLPPVDNEGDGDFSVFRLVPGPRLREVMRAGDAILDVATALREEGRIVTESRGAYEYLEAPVLGTAVEAYLADQNDHALVTWTNRLRMRANVDIREKLGRRGDVPERGEPLLVCRNGQWLMNGQVVTAGTFSDEKAIEDVKIRLTRDTVDWPVVVSLQGRDEPVDGFMPRLEDLAWRRYISRLNYLEMPDPLPLTWGYAMTAHKAQGSEFRRVTVFLPDTDIDSAPFKKRSQLPDGTWVPFRRRWVYTAITRARERLSLIVGPVEKRRAVDAIFRR